MISSERRDYYAGALMTIVGLGAAALARSYGIGTLADVGPGFFPLMLGILLAIVGVTIALLNARSRVPDSTDGAAVGGDGHGIAGPATVPDWRGWSCIIAGVLGFILLAQYAGMLPAIFFCVFVSARGDRNATWRGSLLLAAGMTIFGGLLFGWFLSVQIPIIRGL